MSKKKKKSTEEIQFENELLKLKMRAESGAIFHSGGNADVPPDVENQFLNYVMNFEKNFKNAKRITIGELLNHPEFISYRKLKPGQFHDEIKKIDDLLEAHGIIMHRNDTVNERKLYKFLTTDFMKEETDEMHMPGFTCNYIFEDFFPDDEEEIKNAPYNFLTDLFSKNPGWIKQHLYEKLTDSNGKSVSKDNVLKALIHFQNAFDAFKEIGVEIKSFEFTKRKASLTAVVTYKTINEGKTVKMEDLSFFKFKKNELDFWQISSFNFPGFEI